jgi:multiple sugar transport system ATP-binding protein
VALGRALVREPEVFLLDEPLSNLDAKLRAHMRVELIELHRRLGKTMVYVTHDQLEAMTMSTRIAVMCSGVLQQLATPAQIYRRPANAFVAGFIGTPSMTLAAATQSTSTSLAVGDASWTIPAGHIEDVPAGTALTVGVRPDDIVLGSGPHRAVVKVVEPIGHESIVQITAGGAEFSVRIAGDTHVKPGEAVPFDIRGERLHVFDSASGRRLNNDSA